MPHKVSLYRFLDTPLALYPRVAPELLEGVRRQLLQIELQVPDEYDDGDVPPYDFSNGVAIIPITGVLVNGASGWFGESSYQDIGKSIDMAMGNPDVRAVALQIASPGGEVSGLFDLADQIYSWRGKKPVWGIVDDHAYSAAYALASVADKIAVPRTGGVGSIGVVAMHFDVSEALSNFGVNVSLIQYGDRKTDMSPFKPLGEEARERLQGDVNEIGELFVDTVARNRGIDRGRIRSTEAGIYMGAKGVDQGLADFVQSPTAAFESLSKLVKPNRTVMGPNGPKKESINGQQAADATVNHEPLDRSSSRGGAEAGSSSQPPSGEAGGSSGKGQGQSRGGGLRGPSRGRVGRGRGAGRGVLR